MQAGIPPASLLRALNRTLPAAIRILDATIVPEAFHARHSAVAKTYEYRVLPVEPAAAQLCPPFLARYVYPYSWRLNFESLQLAAAAFIGEHDFRSFAASDPDLSTRTSESADDASVPTQVRTTVRSVFSSEWRQQTVDGLDVFVYRVRGNGFLHHMVRNLVGTMLDMGRGYMRPEAVPKILAAQDRSLAGPTAPARGLFLHSVEYAPVIPAP